MLAFFAAGIILILRGGVRYADIADGPSRLLERWVTTSLAARWGCSMEPAQLPPLRDLLSAPLASIKEVFTAIRADLTL